MRTVFDGAVIGAILIGGFGFTWEAAAIAIIWLLVHAALAASEMTERPEMLTDAQAQKIADDMRDT